MTLRREFFLGIFLVILSFALASPPVQRFVFGVSPANPAELLKFNLQNTILGIKGLTNNTEALEKVFGSIEKNYKIQLDRILERLRYNSIISITTYDMVNDTNSRIVNLEVHVDKAIGYGIQVGKAPLDDQFNVGEIESKNIKLPAIDPGEKLFLVVVSDSFMSQYDSYLMADGGILPQRLGDNDRDDIPEVQSFWLISTSLISLFFVFMLLLNAWAISSVKRRFSLTPDSEWEKLQELLEYAKLKKPNLFQKRVLEPTSEGAADSTDEDEKNKSPAAEKPEVD